MVPNLHSVCCIKMSLKKKMFFFFFVISLRFQIIHFIIHIRIQQMICPFGWGCRIHRLLLCRGVRPPHPNKFPRYDTKQSDGEVPVMLELSGMWSTPSLPFLPGPLWPGMVAPDKGPIYGLNRTNCILMLYLIVWIRTVWLNWIAWNRNVFDN